MKSEQMNENVLNGETKSFLSFKLDGENFTIPVMKIMEILEVPKITKVPQSPNFLVGVINLRGAVLPVIDTRIKFGMTPIEFTINTCILVLSIEVNEEVIEVGALVDSVSEVFELNTNEIKQTPTLASRYRSDYVQGMIQENDHFIMMLDVDKVFSSNDLDSINIASEANVKLEETHTKE